MTWYKVKSKEQVEVIKDIMNAKFQPDSIFNDDYSKLKKSKAGYEKYLIKPIQK